jgi:hypothetical protein
MPQDSKGRATVSFEELAYSNMLIVQALVELLAEKGVLTQKEVTERIQKLKKETQTNKPRQGGN